MSVKPWTKLNCYETLCLEPTATESEVRQAFKTASQKAHPDRGGSHEAQVRINLAYEILKKPETRAQHDRHWKLGSLAKKNVTPYFSTDDAVKNLWSGPGGGAPKLSDGKGSSGLSARIVTRVRQDQDRITRDRQNRASLWLGSAEQRLRQARLESASLTGALLFSGLIGTIYPLAFLGCAGFAWPLAKALRKRPFAEAGEVALWDKSARAKLAQLAEALAQESVERDRARLAVHLGSLKTLSGLVLTPVRASDSEATVVQKFLTVLFVLGLMPLSVEPEKKRIQLQSEAETAALFYRHGANRALSVAAVEELLATQTRLGIKTIYLYNQGGLSKKAAEAADRAGIRWVGLQELNAWAREVWASASSGPGGDILQKLVEFRSFLDQLPH